ncbi:MAG TPA: alpha/beta fold hydrolase [Candidatus Angelobacter sp.]|nr:alpha/beta fold hydrolase [Candidatus Angelobacter sp.]
MQTLMGKTGRLIAAMLFVFPLAVAQKTIDAAPAKTPSSAIAGDWQGTLQAGMQQLHVVLHINQAADGSLSANMDSLDQGAKGIAIDQISFQNGKISFTSNVVHGSYEGKLTPDSAIEGTWTQGQSFPLTFKRAVTTSDADGYWLGTLETAAAKLRVLFRITNTPEGLQATLTSIDQGGGAIPVSSVKRDGSNITMEITSIGGSFTGTFDQGLTKIEGTWSQGGKSTPLTVNRTDADKIHLSARPRPQEPKKPYPYRAEDVKYENKSAGITLGGTLTLPQGKGPFTTVLLITGSGPQDRDEALLGHRPFLVLADYLTRKGIAVLRVDDRGVGESTGDFNAATTADFATDVEAGVAYLKTRPEVDTHKIGLVGHSEGGVIAPMVAARNRDVAFIVMMAGTGVPGDQVIAEQTRLIMEAGGATHEAAEKRAAKELERLTLVKQEKDPAVLEQKLRKTFAEKAPEAQIGTAIMLINSPWMRYFVNYDPAIALSKVTCPVLALNGAKDLQVSPEQNLPPIRRALEAAGNKHFEIVELPGLNHLFQTAKTGSPSEYAQIDETIAPVALETISGWILQQ